MQPLERLWNGRSPSGLSQQNLDLTAADLLCFLLDQKGERYSRAACLL